MIQGKRIDLNELATLLEVPEIQETLYHYVEKLKIIHADKIEKSQRIEPILFDEESNIIPLWYNEFFPEGSTARLRRFIQEIIQYPTVQQIILDDYFFVLKPSLDKSLFVEPSAISG